MKPPIMVPLPNDDAAFFRRPEAMAKLGPGVATSLAEASERWEADGHGYGCYATVDWETGAVVFPCTHPKKPA